MPDFEQVGFLIQFIRTLVPNWLIESLVSFLDVTGTNVFLNKAERLEVGFFPPWKMPCLGWVQQIYSKFPTSVRRDLSPCDMLYISL